MPKEKKLVEFHPSVTIAYCDKGKNSGKLLMAVYDSGYRMKAYVGSANPIGGNPSYVGWDINPKDTLVREISEEYNPNFQGPNHDSLVFGQKVDWASPKDIQIIRDSLLNQTNSWQDFYINFSEQIKNGEKLGDPQGTGIYSVFYSLVGDDAIECAEENILKNKTLSNEGNLGVFTLDDLINRELGKFSVAHAAAPILNKYFGVLIPYPEELKIESMQTQPRNSFQDYLEDFKYSDVKPKPDKPSFRETVFGKE